VSTRARRFPGKNGAKKSRIVGGAGLKRPCRVSLTGLVVERRHAESIVPNCPVAVEAILPDITCPFHPERLEHDRPDRVSPGNHTNLIDCNYDGGGLGKGGTATLMVDGRQVAQGRIERTIPFRISADETLDIGEDTGTTVSEVHQLPFKFTADLKKVAIQLTDAALSSEDEAEIRSNMAEIGLSEQSK
jgi:hypothetical protein